VFKSSLAALCQQHFGAEMSGTRLPSGFGSTAFALQELAFCAKDALLVIDDFAPNGSGDHALQNIAEQVFRAAGNRQGRSRASKLGQPSTPRPPRALVLATGEEVPQGESIRARLVIIEVTANEIERRVLTECQRAGQQEQFSASMGAFLAWIAAQYEPLQHRLHARAEEIRNRGRGDAVHARLPEAMGELQAGLEIFLEFAVEVGAIGKAERNELAHRSVQALDEVLARQAKYHRASDPASHFLTLLQAAIISGHAHIADRRGKTPENAAAWGWRQKSPARAWVPQGFRIGWIAGSDLFLEPTASYEIAQSVAGSERLTVSEQALRHRLHERRLLASVDAGRKMLLVRRTIDGHPRQVLHLNANALTS